MLKRVQSDGHLSFSCLTDQNVIAIFCSYATNKQRSFSILFKQLLDSVNTLEKLWPPPKAESTISKLPFAALYLICPLH